jgi:hypothetical protein
LAKPLVIGLEKILDLDLESVDWNFILNFYAQKRAITKEIAEQFLVNEKSVNLELFSCIEDGAAVQNCRGKSTSNWAAEIMEVEGY